MRRARLLDRLLAVRRRDDIVTGRLQIILNQFERIRLIIDDQDFRFHVSSVLRRRSYSRNGRNHPYLPSIYSAVLGFLGLRNKSVVGLCSTSLPISMKMHSSLARRACAMLCVTMTM